MDELLEFQGNFVDVTNQGTLHIMDENSWNANGQRSLWYSHWQFNCQICLSYVQCTSKLDFYILDAPVSNTHIIEQGVSECFYFSTIVESTI